MRRWFNVFIVALLAGCAEAPSTDEVVVETQPALAYYENTTVEGKILAVWAAGYGLNLGGATGTHDVLLEFDVPPGTKHLLVSFEGQSRMPGTEASVNLANPSCRESNEFSCEQRLTTDSLRLETKMDDVEPGTWSLRVFVRENNADEVEFSATFASHVVPQA